MSIYSDHFTHDTPHEDNTQHFLCVSIYLQCLSV